MGIERKFGLPHKNRPPTGCAKWALKCCFREKQNIDNEDFDGNTDSTIAIDALVLMSESESLQASEEWLDEELL